MDSSQLKSAISGWTFKIQHTCRGAARGGAGGAAAPPDFGRSVNPISTRGG